MKKKLTETQRWRKKQCKIYISLAYLALFIGMLIGFTIGSIDNLDQNALLAGFIVLALPLIPALIVLQTDYFELPSFVNRPLKTDHGDTLAKVMESIRHEEVEFIAIFTKDGKKLYEGTRLNVNTASVPDKFFIEAIRARDVITVHNHPLNREGCSYSFSTCDFGTMFAGDVYRAIVVAPDMTYTMTLDRKDYDTLDASDIRETADDILAEEMKARRFSWNKNKRQEASIVTSRRLAEQFGWTFEYSAYVAPSASCQREKEA